MQQLISPKPFLTSLTIKFREADPAGIMFYGNILGLCHDAFEEFLTHIGVSWKTWFQPTDWACPIRHAEVNYLAPLLPGQTYAVEVSVRKIGSSSFGMNYRFLKDSKEHALVQITHAFVSLEHSPLSAEGPQLKTRPIPSEFKTLFENHLVPRG